MGRGVPYVTMTGKQADDEGETVRRTDRPVTADRLAGDLRELGVAEDAVIVHASLSALGWMPGGAQAAVEALRTAVTPEGTLVMPTHSTQCSDPRNWSNPPVPEAWYDEIRESMPPYRPAVTPTRGMGAIPECFRTYPDVRRSRHPSVSFAAWGADADAVVADHEYGPSLGEGSPLARLYDLDADVLLLGVDHDRNTSLHLAEHRADYPKSFTTDGGPVVEDGERRWVSFEDLEGETADFPDLGADFERERPEAVTRGRAGRATATLLSQPELVDFAADWFEEHRHTGGSRT